MYFQMYTDGASRSNPGHASIGFVIYDHNDQIAYEGSKYIGKATNNVAEYTALLFGCIKLKSLGCTSADIYLDSELVVKQMNGDYKINKLELLKIRQQVIETLEDIKWSIHHVRREKNKHADALANKALDNWKL